MINFSTMKDATHTDPVALDIEQITEAVKKLQEIQPTYPEGARLQCGDISRAKAAIEKARGMKFSSGGKICVWYGLPVYVNRLLLPSQMILTDKHGKIHKVWKV